MLAAKTCQCFLHWYHHAEPRKLTGSRSSKAPQPHEKCLSTSNRTNKLACGRQPVFAKQVIASRPPECSPSSKEFKQAVTASQQGAAMQNAGHQYMKQLPAAHNEMLVQTNDRAVITATARTASSIALTPCPQSTKHQHSHKSTSPNQPLQKAPRQVITPLLLACDIHTPDMCIRDPPSTPAAHHRCSDVCRPQPSWRHPCVLSCCLFPVLSRSLAWHGRWACGLCSPPGGARAACVAHGAARGCGCGDRC